ncbi:hypothetical protein H6F78_23380 [Coleofasciculus sp. FACHB-64]|uniref:hypothetical protein n=1 Tax=Cyanophyceae TaxID=3028117 RepID=UPI001685C52D|nr:MULTISPECIES: hypothetical protein [unclassified Coleofasciculus]MBD1838944.1 hypothetical protein [Coleofasciculus sp. FACHB-501]MBD2048500.1 hypothetical protein [Coleofasciculus sp. FACHB-64]
MLSKFHQNLSRSIVTFCVTLACVLAIGVLQVSQLNRLRIGAKTTSQQNLNREVDTERLRLNLLQKTPSFGFYNIFADWVMLGFLSYFGDDTAREETGYNLSPEYFEIIVDRDPRFLQAYLVLSTSISMYAGMPEKSVALMQKGLHSLSPKALPRSYYVWRYKGTDELLFLGDAQAARKSFEKAAEWASVYEDPESKNVAAISRQTAQFLARNPNSKSAQVGAWTMILQNAVDDRTRKIAISRIEVLGGKVIITPEGGVQVQLPEQD